jgi:hypothetical protein
MQKDHQVAIKVMKGRSSISTSTIHIKRIPKLPEPKRYALLIVNNDYQKVFLKSSDSRYNLFAKV